MFRVLHIAMILAWAAGSLGCSAITDLSRFRGYETLTLQLRGFSPHVNELFDVQVVANTTPTDRIVVGYARIDPLPGPDFDVVLQRVLDPTVMSYRLDFFADHDGLHDRVYDPPNGMNFSDHSWRIDPVRADGEAPFTHNTLFADLSMEPPTGTGASMTLHLSGADDWNGQTLEVFVSSGGQQFGYYRLGQVAGGDVDITLPDFADNGTTYDIELRSATQVCHASATATTTLVIDQPLSELTCSVR